MKRTNKKGFTIVELVIVIAVIAILAAVLIPNISRLVKKAQISSDLSLVKNLNTALSIGSATMDYPTAHDAFEAVKENGYDLTKIEAKADKNKILYDSENKCFAYLNGSDVEYYPDSRKSKDMPEKYNLWAICTSVEDAKNSEYSVYWNGESDVTIAVSKAGFDAGNQITKEVIYDGSAPVIIRTNGGKVTVNAPNGHVEHYGLANEADIQAVSASTYVENGVVGKMTVAAAANHVVIKTMAVVGEIDNKSSNLVIENGGFVAKATEGSTNPKSGSIATDGKTISASTYEQLQGLALASTVGVDLKDKTIELAQDIDLTGKSWQPFGFDISHPFEGTIDGKGHTIKGLSPNGYHSEAIITNNTNKATGNAYGFICIAKNATVKNIHFVDVNISIENGLAVGAVVGDARGNSLTIENVTVSGSISAKDKVGGFVGLAGYNDSTELALTIKNSTNNANVTAISTEKYNRAGGFVGGLGDINGNTVLCKTVKFENCTNNGNVSVTGNQVKVDPNSSYVMAGGFIGSTNMGSVNKIVTATGCTNTGTIMATNTATGETKTVSGASDGVKNTDKLVMEYPIFDVYKAQ